MALRSGRAVAFLGVILVLAQAWPVAAYGPSIHIRESMKFQELNRQFPQTGLQHDPAYLDQFVWELRLGAIWPDLGRVIVSHPVPPKGFPRGAVNVDEGMVDPHNRHFNMFMMQQGLSEYPNNPWKVAFGLGNLCHNTGDGVSQSMLVPHMSVRGRMGPLDLTTVEEHGVPDGADEDFIEGAMEFVHPAPGVYADMTKHFILDPVGQAELGNITYWYLDQYFSYFHLPRAMMPRNDDVLDLVIKLLEGLPLSLLQPIAKIAYQWLESNFSLAVLAQLPVHWDEVTRLLLSPVMTPAFWQLYYTEGFFTYSPTALLTFRDGEWFWDELPNWSPYIMQMGATLAFNVYNPTVLEPEDAIFPLNWCWQDEDTGACVRSVSASKLPTRIRLSTRVFQVPGRTKVPTDPTITLRIRADMGDHVALGGKVIAAASFDVASDIWDFNATTPSAPIYRPTTLTVDFSAADLAPFLGQLKGLHGELVHGSASAALPFFTSDWEGCYVPGVAAHVNLQLPVYDYYGAYRTPQLYSLAVNA